jgi:hypothetical protein
MLHPQGQGDGHHRRQAFGDGRHGQTDGGHEHRVSRPAAHDHAEDKQQAGGPEDGQRQPPAKGGHLAQQGRGRGLHGLEHVPDAANLGAAARGHHHGARLALGHQGAGIAHADAVADRRRGLHGVGLLVYRHRFAGEHGFIDAQIARLQQPHIRRQPVARGQQHHVTGHQLSRIDIVGMAIANHHGVRREHVADGLQRPLGLALLDEADAGIEQDHRQDHTGVHPMGHQPRDEGRCQQHVDQQVVELACQAPQRVHRPHLGQPVRPVLGQAPVRFFKCQALMARALSLQDFLGGLGMPIGHRFHRLSARGSRHPPRSRRPSRRRLAPS